MRMNYDDMDPRDQKVYSREFIGKIYRKYYRIIKDCDKFTCPICNKETRFRMQFGKITCTSCGQRAFPNLTAHRKRRE